MEALSTMWGKINLLEKEDVKVHIGDESAEPWSGKGQFYLVGKLLADRVVPKDLFRVHMKRAWKILGSVSFKVLGENLFVIEFEHDWERIQDDFTAPSEMAFDKASFWIRMYNLPLACMNSMIGHQVGSTVGLVEEVKANEREMAWGEYLQVQIVIDLTKPLDQGRKLTIKNKSTWIVFKYEKLPNFCYNYGVVRHGKNGCEANGA
ncbi:uncharacterized protein LOC133881040 [Alnus glutinosa]|uniref:uncharacterized protein LOC133881040 n=1 Tax=Alnus glutinosa TaxID=3517 RepID=UPI002D7A2393|nr:uncharacterized protein LOC133881040 [Alnus glutinosa]